MAKQVPLAKNVGLFLLKLAESVPSKLASKSMVSFPVGSDHIVVSVVID